MITWNLLDLFWQHFSGSTGYGHNDAGGREALDKAFAEIVGAERAIIRSQVCIVHLCQKKYASGKICSRVM